MVTYSNQLQNDKYIFGTMATYTCSTGYGLSSTGNRSCVTDNGGGTIGRFSGREPSCDRELVDYYMYSQNYVHIHKIHCIIIMMTVRDPVVTITYTTDSLVTELTEPSSSSIAMVGGIAAAIVILVVAVLIIGAVILIIFK